MEIEEESQPVLTLDSYEKQRHLLYEFQLNQSGFFDKGILTLSSSALGILIATKHNAAAIIDKHPTLFIIAILSFAASLILTLLSFRTSIRGLKRQIDILNNAFTTQEIKEDDSDDTIWDVITTLLNAVSLIAFIVGVGLVSVIYM